MKRRPSSTAILDAAVLAGAVTFVLLQLRPDLLLADTTPAGGDMGAHVWGPAYLRDNLLPDFRVTGWTPDWYAGFPALQFYFPLPSLLIVALGLVLPYGVAFKLVSVAGVLALPVCAYAFGRLVNLRFPAPSMLALATLPFLFDRFHTIYGGNIPATLAGEFSFGHGLALALLFLGVFARGLETGRHRSLAAVLLAATALSHLLPTLFAVVGAGLLLISRLNRRRLWYAVCAGAVGFLITAFWVLPFAANLALTNDMGWEKIERYTDNLFPYLSPCDPGAACGPSQFPRSQTWHLIPVTALAAVGAGVAVSRRNRGASFVVAMAAASAAAFVFAPPARLWNARALPFWFLSLYLLAGFGLSEAIRSGATWFDDARLRQRRANAADAESEAQAERAAEPVALDDASREPVAVAAPPSVRRRAGGIILAAPVAMLAATCAFLSLPLGSLPSWVPLTTTDHSYIPSWVRWNYSGYERKDKYPEYKAIVATMARVGIEHGCGRSLWEYRQELDQYGTPMALMLLPYWTDGCIGSMEGLFFESSATTPYHFLMQSELSNRPSRAQRDLPYRDLDLALGVRHLQLMGVRYYMAMTPEAIAAADAQPDLERIATSPPWQVYRVQGSPLVEPVPALPAVVEGLSETNGDWLEVSTPWFQNPTRWPVLLAQDGPGSWPRVRVTREEAGDDRTVGAGVTVTRPRVVRTSPVRVSNIRSDDDSILFEVDRPGTPLLVKASYFPNWKASGADGPWRVTPNLMVVVPTERSVSMTYGRTPVDWAGIVASVLGLALAVLMWRRGPVDVRSRRADADAGTTAAVDAAAGEGVVSELRDDAAADDGVVLPRFALTTPRRDAPPAGEPPLP